MKVLVVNLERAAQRRAFMQEQLTKLGLDYEIIKGVDYKSLSDSDFEEFCSTRAIDGNSYLRSVFAASLSHLQILNTIVANHLPHALVLEDDVILPEDIAELLVDLGSRCCGDSIYLLNYYSHRDCPLMLSRHGSISCGRHGDLLAPVEISRVASAAAYIVPQPVAERMLAGLRPVDHVPDNWGLFYEKGAFKRLFCLYPQVVRDAPFVPLVDYPAKRALRSRLKAAIRRVSLLNNLVGRLRREHLAERFQIALTNEHPFWGQGDRLADSVRN